MSNVLSNPVASAALDRPARPIPVGMGLLIGAGASLGLWGALIWGAVALLA